MTDVDLSFLPLRVTRVGVCGKRSFDPVGKRQLVEACEQPGASLSGLALKAGVNANQLRRWVQLHRQAQTRVSNDDVAASPSAFVPIIAIADTAPAPASMHSVRVQPGQPLASPIRIVRDWVSAFFMFRVPAKAAVVLAVDRPENRRPSRSDGRCASLYTSPGA